MPKKAKPDPGPMVYVRRTEPEEAEPPNQPRMVYVRRTEPEEPEPKAKKKTVAKKRRKRLSLCGPRKRQFAVRGFHKC